MVPGLIALLVWLALVARAVETLSWPVIQVECVENAAFVDYHDEWRPASRLTFVTLPERTILHIDAGPESLYLPGGFYELRQCPTDPQRVTDEIYFHQIFLRNSVLLFLGSALLFIGRWLNRLLTFRAPYAASQACGGRTTTTVLSRDFKSEVEVGPTTICIRSQELPLVLTGLSSWAAFGLAVVSGSFPLTNGSGAILVGLGGLLLGWALRRRQTQSFFVEGASGTLTTGWRCYRLAQITRPRLEAVTVGGSTATLVRLNLDGRPVTLFLSKDATLAGKVLQALLERLDLGPAEFA